MRFDHSPTNSSNPYAIDRMSDGDSPMAYRGLLFLIFVIYIAPQALFPSLMALHLAKLSAAFAIVAYVGHVMTRGRRWTVMTTEVRLILTLFGLGVASIPFSMWPGGSFEFLLDQYSKSIIIFFLVANLLVSMERYRSFLWTIGLFAGFNGIMGVKNYFGGVYKLGRVQGAASGIAGNPNDLALVMNLTLPFLFFLYATARSTSQRFVLAALIALSIGTIVITFSRAGFVTLVFLVLWLAWVRGRHQGMRSFWKVVGGGGVILLMLTLGGPDGYGSRLVTIVDTDQDKTGSAQARWQLMMGTVQGMLSHPLGVGLNMNNLMLNEMMHGWAGVHNIYLEMGTDLGFPALIIFLVLLYRLITAMKVIRMGYDPQSEMSRLAEAAGGSMVAFAVTGMFYPVAYHFHFYILAGLVVACQQLAILVDSDSEENMWGPSAPVEQNWTWRCQS